MKRTNLYIGLCLLLVVGLLSSCKTKQISTTSSELSVVDYTVTQVQQQQPQFNYLNISKMDIVANYGAQQLSFRATVKAVTDSLVAVSIQPLLGVEMFRVEFTPTSFRIIDKWNRKYTDNTYDFLRYSLGVNVDFKVIQAVLFNQLFVVDGTVSPNQFVVETLPQEPTRLVHLGTGLIQRFELVDKQMAIAKTELIVDKGRLTCSYANHRMQNAVRFPMTMTVALQFGGKTADLACETTQLEFNKPFEYSTINLERYEKVAFSKIIP